MCNSLVYRLLMTATFLLALIVLVNDISAGFKINSQTISCVWIIAISVIYVYGSCIKTRHIKLLNWVVLISQVLLLLII